MFPSVLEFFPLFLCQAKRLCSHYKTVGEQKTQRKRFLVKYHRGFPTTPTMSYRYKHTLLTIVTPEAFFASQGGFQRACVLRWKKWGWEPQKSLAVFPSGEAEGTCILHSAFLPMSPLHPPPADPAMVRGNAD